ncbi:hypothetical protein [Actinoplanes sp. URMC 104]
MSSCLDARRGRPLITGGAAGPALLGRSAGHADAGHADAGHADAGRRPS